jgi:hypothetical protein
MYRLAGSKPDVDDLISDAKVANVSKNFDMKFEKYKKAAQNKLTKNLKTIEGKNGNLRLKADLESNLISNIFDAESDTEDEFKANKQISVSKLEARVEGHNRALRHLENLRLKEGNDGYAGLYKR